MMNGNNKRLREDEENEISAKYQKKNSEETMQQGSELEFDESGKTEVDEQQDDNSLCHLHINPDFLSNFINAATDFYDKEELETTTADENILFVGKQVYKQNNVKQRVYMIGTFDGAQYLNETCTAYLDKQVEQAVILFEINHIKAEIHKDLLIEALLLHILYLIKDEDCPYTSVTFKFSDSLSAMEQESWEKSILAADILIDTPKLKELFDNNTIKIERQDLILDINSTTKAFLDSIPEKQHEAVLRAMQLEIENRKKTKEGSQQNQRPSSPAVMVGYFSSSSKSPSSSSESPQQEQKKHQTHDFIDYYHRTVAQ